MITSPFGMVVIFANTTMPKDRPEVKHNRSSAWRKTAAQTKHFTQCMVWMAASIPRCLPVDPADEFLLRNYDPAADFQRWETCTPRQLIGPCPADTQHCRHLRHREHQRQLAIVFVRCLLQSNSPSSCSRSTSLNLMPPLVFFTSWTHRQRSSSSWALSISSPAASTCIIMLISTVSLNSRRAMRVSLPWTVARKADTNAAGRYSTALSAEMYPAYICAACSRNSLRLLQLAWYMALSIAFSVDG